MRPLFSTLPGLALVVIDLPGRLAALLPAAHVPAEGQPAEADDEEGGGHHQRQQFREDGDQQAKGDQGCAGQPPQPYRVHHGKSLSTHEPQSSPGASERC